MSKWHMAGDHLAMLTLALATAASATCRAAASDPVANTVLALERGIDALTDPAADFHTVFQTLASALPAGADTSVGVALKRFLARAPASGADFRCSADVVRLRARQELIRLEERVLAIPPAPTEPQFCYAAPFAVDLTRVPSTLEIYGYDLDVVPLEMFLVTTDRYHDVSSALVPRTHYHLTLVLGAGGVRLPRNARMLGLTWGNLIHHAIPIVGPWTPLCSCTIEEIPAGRTVEFTPPPIGRGHASAVRSASLAAWANVLLDYESNELSATVCMTATPTNDGGSIRGGCNHAFILTVDPDRTIEGLLGRAEGRATYSGPIAPGAEFETQGDGGRIGRWRFAGFGTDTAGPRITLELAMIRLVSTGGEGCVSPIAYLEARRTGAMSATTMKTLDAQMLSVNPEIAGLRPRFAPAIR